MIGERPVVGAQVTARFGIGDWVRVVRSGQLGNIYRVSSDDARAQVIFAPFDKHWYPLAELELLESASAKGDSEA